MHRTIRTAIVLSMVVALLIVAGSGRSTRAEHTTASNGIYDLFVEHDTSSDGIGTYTAGTGPSHPVTVDQGSRQNVLYNGDSGDAWSSYTTIRSYTSDTDYVQTTDLPSSSNAVVNMDSFATTTDLGSTGFQTTYTLPGPFGKPGTPDQLEITQVWRVNGTTVNNSVVELTTTVENTGSSPVSIGIRYQWDVQMSCDDGPTFTPIDAFGNPVGPTLTTEQTFAAPTFPAYRIEDNDCTDSPLLSVFGTAGPSGLQPPPTQPELLMYADWGSAFDAAFDYTTNPADSGPDGDSAVLYFYGATQGSAIDLSPGESVSVRAELFAGQAGEPPPVFPTPTSSLEPTGSPPSPAPTAQTPGAPPSAFTPTATVAVSQLPGTGTGGRNSGDASRWLVVGLTAAAALVAGGYGARRLRPWRRSGM